MSSDSTKFTLVTRSTKIKKNLQPNVSEDEYDSPDDMSKKISQQIDDEERLWDIFLEMKNFVEYECIPLLQKLDIEKISDFISPLRIRVF